MGNPPYSVPQEIHYLASLTGINCARFRHSIVTANRNDPVGEAADRREAHLFVDEDDPRHGAFSNTAGLVGGIDRKLDCVPDEGQQPGLCYLVDTPMSKAFEEIAAVNGIEMAWGIVPGTDKVLMSHNPPDNLTWLVTWIAIESYNPTLYLTSGIAQPGGQIGDMRSQYIDWNGFTAAWLAVKTNPVIAAAGVASVWLNKPVLFAFQGGRRVRLIIRRSDGSGGSTVSLPVPSFQVQVAMHGYLAPPEAYDCLADNVTKVEQHTGT